MEGAMPEKNASAKKGLLATIGAGAVAVLAFIASHAAGALSGEFGKWLGLSMLLPLVILFASCWVMGKLLSEDIRFLNFAAGIPAGQAIIFLIPVFIFGPAAITAVAIDFIAILIGLVWLFARPSTGPLIWLLAYEALGLVMNAYGLLSSDAGQSFYKGVIVSIFIRIFVLFVLYDGYKKMKSRAVAATAPSAP
jgi:hypothetical protein